LKKLFLRKISLFRTNFSGSNMIGCCCGSPEIPLEPFHVMNISQGQKSTIEDGLQDKERSPTSELDQVAQTTTGKPEMEEKIRSFTPIERDPKFIFSIKFETSPLGIVVASDEDGNCAYVTRVNGEKNKAIENNVLPLNSKLLKVNDKEVELYKFEDATGAIKECLETLPLVLTFCHPDGLKENERSDETMHDDNSEQQNIS